MQISLRNKIKIKTHLRAQAQPESKPKRRSKRKRRFAKSQPPNEHTKRRTRARASRYLWRVGSELALVAKILLDFPRFARRDQQRCDAAPEDDTRRGTAIPRKPVVCGTKRTSVHSRRNAPGRTHSCQGPQPARNAQNANESGQEFSCFCKVFFFFLVLGRNSRCVIQRAGYLDKEIFAYPRSKNSLNEVWNQELKLKKAQERSGLHGH